MIQSDCITDLLEKQEFEVEHCPTEDMQADFLTKPLQGDTFKKMFKWLILSFNGLKENMEIPSLAKSRPREERSMIISG